MMDLMQENEENRRRMALTVISGAITMIAVCALIVIAACLRLPAAARVLVILLAVLTGAAGMGATAALDRRAGCFQCPHCGALFVPAMSAYIKSGHTFTRRRLTCPECGRTGMCRHRVVR